MKKTLIASAVAAAALSSNAFAMDQATDLAEQLNMMPEFYGNIQLAYLHTDEDDNGVETSTNEMIDNGSTLGLKHDHEISEGVTGFLKAEFEFEADDKGASGGLNSLDEAYIGVKGSFGSVQLGTDDSVYEWVDILDMYEAIGLEGELASFGEGDNLQYTYGMDALTLGATIKVDSDSTDAAALGAKFETDQFGVIATYAMGREEQGYEKGDSYGIAGTLALGDLSLGLQYEGKGEDNSDGDDQTFIGFLAQYGLEATNFALGYSILTEDRARDDLGAIIPGVTERETSSLYLQALHNVSDQMYVYAEFTMATEDNTLAAGGSVEVDTDKLALGATYAF